MRTPLRASKSVGAPTAIVQSYPPPIGGWNARDSLASMPPTDAVTLTNWYPRPSYVEFRGGYVTSATGTTQNIKTLAVHAAIGGTNKMFGYTSAGIYDVSSAGAVGASKLSRTNGKHQTTMFGDGTNNWLIACNGVDKPAYFDGTTWTAVDNATSPALIGVTSSTLIQPLTFKNRLFFVQTGTLVFWYLPPAVAGGTLTAFDLSGQFKRGGYLMAIGNWTRDAGDGQDDVFVAVSSEGEAVVYQGDNPNLATAWSKVGTFYVGKPIGRRCMTQYGGDLIVLTENGAFPLSAALQSAIIDNKQAISFKITNAFSDAASTSGSVFGWETTIFPAKNAMIVNIPQAEDGTHQQYVMNTITQSWCKFTGWDAETFCVFNAELYFSKGTGTFKAWTGTIDGTNDIIFYGKQAFNYFGRMGYLKRFKLYRPVISCNGNIAYLTDIDVDFDDDDITGSATFTVTNGAEWDVDKWDVGMWGAGQAIVKQWTSPQEWQGYCAAAKLKITSNATTARWMSNDMVFEMGGIV